MKRLLTYGIVFVGFSIGFYYATFHAIPHVIYLKFEQKVRTERGLKKNEFSMIMAPDEDSRMVVKPNPDFAYAHAFYDLSDGPLRLKGNMPDSTYWSIALYEPNTINFYVQNDKQFNTNQIDLILAYEGSDGGSSNVDVLSTVKTGFVLVRLLIKERSANSQEQMKSFLQSLRFENI